MKRMVFGLSLLSLGLAAAELPAWRGDALKAWTPHNGHVRDARVEDGVMKNVRIALTTAAPTPMRSINAEAVLEGQPISDEIIVKAAEAVAAEGKPRSSWRSSAEFRTRLLHDVTIIVLHEAVQRAQKPWAEKADKIPMQLYTGLEGLLPRPKEED